MKKTLILISCFLINYCHAQKKCFSKSWSLAITNSHTAKPFRSFAALAYKNFHPGIEGGMQLIIKEKSVDSNRIKHQWLLNLKSGYMYHQWVQHNIALYATYGYRKYFLKTFSAEIKAGGGYQQVIADSKIFKLTDEGIKKKTNWGRPQLIATVSLVLNKEITFPFNCTLFFEYQQRIQTPFIKEYVPILPYNILMIGASFPIKRIANK